MSRFPTMGHLLAHLRAEWPSVEFDGGDSPGVGYWLRAEQGDWLWLRQRVTSVDSLGTFVESALFAARAMETIRV